MNVWVALNQHASGKDTGVIDIVLIGEINKIYLQELIEKAEDLVQRKIRYLVMNQLELDNYLNNYNGHLLLVWNK